MRSDMLDTTGNRALFDLMLLLCMCFFILILWFAFKLKHFLSISISWTFLNSMLSNWLLWMDICRLETGNMCLDIMIWVGIHFILALTLEYAQWKRAYMQWARSMGVDTIANKKTLFVTLVGHADWIEATWASFLPISTLWYIANTDCLLRHVAKFWYQVILCGQQRHNRLLYPRTCARDKYGANI